MLPMGRWWKARKRKGKGNPANCPRLWLPCHMGAPWALTLICAESRKGCTNCDAKNARKGLLSSNYDTRLKGIGRKSFEFKHRPQAPQFAGPGLASASCPTQQLMSHPVTLNDALNMILEMPALDSLARTLWDGNHPQDFASPRRPQSSANRCRQYFIVDRNRCAEPRNPGDPTSFSRARGRVTTTTQGRSFHRQNT